MYMLEVFKTDKGHFAVRPMEWEGIWNDDGKIKECGLRHTAIFATKEDAEWYANAKNAEEQGLMLRLPCNVGDTVYYIDDCYVYSDKVNSIDISKENDEYIFTIAYMDYREEDFGKTVFLTQEQAEQKLKEIEHK